jgi:uncharacterized protein
VAYSDPNAKHRAVPGLLDDYAATAIACLDAYEATADLSYFRFAQSIADTMIARFFDPVSGGFFDAAPSSASSLGVLSTRRKPLQDSPTPAGNPMAVIALLRLHHYTDDARYREKAEQTLEAFAGVVGQLGIFAATYGIAVTHFLNPAVQVVVIAAEESQDGKSQHEALELATVAHSAFAFNKSVLRLSASRVVAETLPPALALTLPHLPLLHSGKSFAVLCSGSTCQPPITSSPELSGALKSALNPNTRLQTKK